MGISTGYCTVGNFGSKQRLDYTVFGRAVNMASRLQTEAPPDTILMDQSTKDLVAERERSGQVLVRRQLRRRDIREHAVTVLCDADRHRNVWLEAIDV